jgi:hypothetical protein
MVLTKPLDGLHKLNRINAFRLIYTICSLLLHWSGVL